VSERPAEGPLLPDLVQPRRASLPEQLGDKPALLVDVTGEIERSKPGRKPE
jgi:hypothetical protein